MPAESAKALQISLITTIPQPLARSVRNLSWTKRRTDVEAAVGWRRRGRRVEGKLARQQRPSADAA